MMKLFHIIILAFLIFPNLATADDKDIRTVSVQGQAEQEFAPDIAKFSITITGKSIKRDEAKSLHDKLLKSLLAISQQYKIESKDISTGFSSLNPNYDYSNNKRKFIDYSMQSQINLTLRDLTQIAQLQDALVNAGFDNFQGPNYTLDKFFTYQDKVLANAVENARQKATNIAEKIGEKIDKPVSIKEEGTMQYAQPPVMYAKSMMVSSAADSAPAQPAGVINIRSSVVATFSLK